MPPVPDNDDLNLIVGFLAPISNAIPAALSSTSSVILGTKSGLVAPAVAPAKNGRYKRKQPAAPTAKESIDPVLAHSGFVCGGTWAHTRQLQA
jgi:hypothetical protein